MDKLYYYCANNQKTGDPEWELMLESMVDSSVATIKPVNYSTRDPLSLLASTQRWDYSINKSDCGKHSRIFIFCDTNFRLFEIHPDFETDMHSLKLKSFEIQILFLV